MKIKVNGEEKEIELDQDNVLLSTALNSMGYKPNTIVVELNYMIINSNFATTKIYFTFNYRTTTSPYLFIYQKQQQQY